MAVSKRTRYEVLRRDNFTCRYCRSKESELTIDHVTPVALGGTDDPSNLVACCKDCNAGKTSTSPDAQTVADVADDAIRWARAMQVAAEDRRKARVEREAYSATFNEYWECYTFGFRDESAPRPLDALLTVRKFHELGVHVGDLCDAADIALSNDRVAVGSKWRYFCGVAWKRLSEQQEAAHALVSTGTPTADSEKTFDSTLAGWQQADIGHRLLANVVEGSYPHLRQMFDEREWAA